MATHKDGYPFQNAPPVLALSELYRVGHGNQTGRLSPMLTHRFCENRAISPQTGAGGGSDNKRRSASQRRSPEDCLLAASFRVKLEEVLLLGGQERFSPGSFWH